MHIYIYMNIHGKMFKKIYGKKNRSRRAINRTTRVAEAAPPVPPPLTNERMNENVRIARRRWLLNRPLEPVGHQDRQEQAAVKNEAAAEEIGRAHV